MKPQPHIKLKIKHFIPIYGAFKYYREFMFGIVSEKINEADNDKLKIMFNYHLVATLAVTIPVLVLMSKLINN